MVNNVCKTYRGESYEKEEGANKQNLKANKNVTFIDH